MLRSLLTVMASTLVGCAGLAHAADANSTTAGAASCPGNGKPMVVGYFDHTAAWYRSRPRFRSDQTVAHVWKSGNPDALVVLYNDIAGARRQGATDGATAQPLQRRIEDRNADISDYLETANKNGKVKVLLQLPDELVRRWSDDQTARDLLLEYISRWSRYPALAGFYLFDEPELKALPTSTLQEVTSAIKQHAPDGRNTAAISVAYSGKSDMNPRIRAYASATPRAFDVLLVNRYPIYRKYGLAGPGRSPAMGDKLGLSDEKAKRENLADNEFSNLDEYYPTLRKAVGLPGLAGRPIYMSMQAFGLRDDCDGPACKATREHNPRRSPTWNELLYLLTSIWMSGADGAVLFSHYFSLYDKALRARLDNLEKLMSRVYAYLPECEPVAIEPRAKEGVIARYAGRPGAGKPEFLVIMHDIQGRTSVRISLNSRNRPTRVEELRFDMQGNSGGAAGQTATAAANVDGNELRLSLQGFGVKIFQLRYE